MSQSSPKANLGEVIIAQQVITSQLEPRRARTIVLLLAASVALMMTGFGIIMPVFARRLSEFGDGVEALGLMTMAFALAQMIASPIIGSMADKYGRRPIILLSLAAFVLTNIGYLIAQSTNMFIAFRAVGGFLTAGLFPAAMGVVADTIPEENRGRWIGVIMSGYGIGFIFGPVLGGFLYDSWGFAMPFSSSATLGGLALIAAIILIPETRTHTLRIREALILRRKMAIRRRQSTSFWDTMPKPLYIFGVLLIVEFAATFAFAFIEPEMVFYVYDVAGWSTMQFGVVVGVYGLVMVLGQTLLGQLSDRFGRKLVIVVGIILNASLYFGLTYFNDFALMLAFAGLSGFGRSLIDPAINAFYLDITAPEHRSRVVGIKGSALSLGGVLGPLLVVFASGRLSSLTIFLSAGVLMLFNALIAAIILREPASVQTTEAIDWEISEQRGKTAVATLQGLVMNATSIRKARLSNR
ncbi:MAG: MFS transporter [Chloroflexi bacterium]|nr:MAG: MFS transporter [Chloroflexota bacterium]